MSHEPTHLIVNYTGGPEGVAAITGHCKCGATATALLLDDVVDLLRSHAPTMRDDEWILMTDALNDRGISYETWIDMLGESVHVPEAGLFIYPPSQNVNGPVPPIWSVVFQHESDGYLDIDYEKEIPDDLTHLHQLDVRDSEFATEVVADVVETELR